MLLSELWLPAGQVQGVSGGEAVFKLASASPVVLLSLVSAQTWQNRADNCNVSLTNEIMQTKSIHSWEAGNLLRTP